MKDPIHPDDVLFFSQVCTAMRRVAAKYMLPIGRIEHTPNPSFSSALGYCHWNGTIQITMRVRENGAWTSMPMSPHEIWKTAAHELAHLRYFNHGEEFQLFEEELLLAMTVVKPDEKDKVIDKLHKLQAQQQSEKALGNEQAAEAFAGMVNKMLIDHELSPSTLEDAKGDDPVIELRTNLELYGVKKTRTRIAWQESLAHVIAQANLCRILIRPSSNDVYFVGTKSHATIAEYLYGTMVPTVDLMSEKEAYRYKLRMNRERTPKLAKGFREAWQVSFINRLSERFDEARKSSIREAVDLGKSDESTALVVLNNQMVKVSRYIDDKFRGTRKYANQLNGGSAGHADGRAAGRAAADRLDIGRKGISGNSVKGILS